MIPSSEADIELLRTRNLSLRLGRQLRPAAIKLLCDTIWGMPGAMQYQHLDTAQKIGLLKCPWFLSLAKDEDTVAVICLDQRKFEGWDAFHIRYFSFAAGMRRKGVGADASDHPVSRGQGLFKRFSTQFFQMPTALLEAAGADKAVFYAFIELENARSRDMVAQMGLIACGTFSTLIFSRLFPKRKASVRRANPAEYAGLRTQVRATYADHAFFEDQALFMKGDFFVLEHQGQVVAGCQANRVHWRVVGIPGWTGRLLMQVLPYIPLLSRLMNPDKFDFAGVEGLFCLAGHEHRLGELLEGILAVHDLHSALLWLSPQAPIYGHIRRNVRMGMLQRFKKDVPVAVAMRAYGLSTAELASLQNRPVYVSAFDAT